MPIANPLLIASVRRQWTLIGAIGFLVAFTVAHQVWFRPTADRYKKVLKQANELGMVLDQGAAPAILPPRLFALVADNSLPAEQAVTLSNSGTLTAQLLEDVTRMTSQRSMQVMVTEPGPVSQQAKSLQVRAHIKVRGRYGQFVALLRDLAASGELYAVDRFSISPDGSGGQVLDLYVSRLFLKRDKTSK
jgi:hypothetical protein